MLHRYSRNGITWIDSEIPTEGEVQRLVDEYSLDARIKEELLVETFRPHTRRFKDCLYVVLHFPALRHSHNGDRRQEIDFVLGKDFLITNHADTVDSIHKLAKVFEVESITRSDDPIDGGVGELFYRIVRKLYRSVMHELEFQSDELLQVEARLFDGKETDTLERLSRESLNLLIIEQTIALHKDLFKDLEKSLDNFLGQEAALLMPSLRSEYERVFEKARVNRGLVDELRTTNDSLLANKQNEIAKKLTIIATIVLPATLISGFLGMDNVNMSDISILSSPSASLVVISLMVAASLFFYLLFKFKRWF